MTWDELTNKTANGYDMLKRKGVNKMIKGLSNYINILNYNYDNLL